MSAKLRVSYQNDTELEVIKRRLGPLVLKCKLGKAQKSKYKLAYIDVKPLVQIPEKPENT